MAPVATELLTVNNIVMTFKIIRGRHHVHNNGSNASHGKKLKRKRLRELTGSDSGAHDILRPNAHFKMGPHGGNSSFHYV